MKKTWNKLYDKVSKIDTADFTEEEMENIDNAWVVVAKDKFLTGWGPSEHKNTYQVVICWNLNQRDNVYDHFCNDDTFTLAVKYKMDDFLKSQRHNALLTCKNARFCPAWTKEDK